MPLINEIHIIGRACSDPEQKGKGPHRFRMAFGGGKSKAGKEYPTEFFTVVCWDETESAKVKKGAKLAISGRLHDSTWTDKEGARHYGTDIVALEITLEDSKASAKVAPAEEALDVPF